MTVNTDDSDGGDGSIDPVTPEVVRNQLESVAEEMGQTLIRGRIRRTSRSAGTARRRCSTLTGG